MIEGKGRDKIVHNEKYVEGLPCIPKHIICLMNQYKEGPLQQNKIHHTWSSHDYSAQQIQGSTYSRKI